jgi:hypothetical protein
VAADMPAAQSARKRFIDGTQAVITDMFRATVVQQDKTTAWAGRDSAGWS